MPPGESHFTLPSRVDGYLATLNRVYEREHATLLREIVVNGVVSIQEGWEFDNWNGGTHGHAITLTVPEEVFVRAIEQKETIQTRLAKDLNRLDHTQNEHVSKVFIEMHIGEPDRWRAESGVFRPLMAAHSIPAESLQRIWGPREIRVFLSHKATVKVQAFELKKSFARCGIAAFVAHEDIEPTQEWQREIERALFSMDALVALLTPDFHLSDWTDQEVGVAIGRGVPLVAVRLGLDPYGLMGKGQGLGGVDWADTDSIARKVFQLLSRKLMDKSRIAECALAAYAASESFAYSAQNVEHLLANVDNLTSTQVERLVAAWRTNTQNRSSWRGAKLLLPLLKRWTGKEWTCADDELKTVVPYEPDIPF